MSDALDHLVSVVESALPTWPDALPDCADALGALARSHDLAARVTRELSRVVEAPTATPTGRASKHAWALWSSPTGARITLLRVAGGDVDDAGLLTDVAWHQVIAACGALPLEGERYTQDVAPDPEVMDPSYALTRRGGFTLHRGETLHLRPRRDVVDLAARLEDRLALVLDGPHALTQQWVYARSTRLPVSSVAADPHDARLEAAMRLLRVLGHTGGAPAVLALTEHPAHFVRWTAIRHALALDPAQGRLRLAAAVDDPHPHVRAAARRAMAQLSMLDGSRGDPR